MFFHGLWTEIVRTIELSNLGRSYASFRCNHIRMILVVLRLKLLQKVLQANASSFVGKRAWCFLVFFNRVIQILTRSEPNHNYHAITVNDKPRPKLNRTKRRLENINFLSCFQQIPTSTNWKAAFSVLWKACFLVADSRCPHIKRASCMS